MNIRQIKNEAMVFIETANKALKCAHAGPDAASLRRLI
jgi:hypothetical protein